MFLVESFERVRQTVTVWLDFHRHLKPSREVKPLPALNRITFHAQTHNFRLCRLNVLAKRMMYLRAQTREKTRSVVIFDQVNTLSTFSL